MTDTQTKSLKLLRDGYKQDFAVFVSNDKRFGELLQELAEEFVSENIPIVDQDVHAEMSQLIKESIYID